MKAVALVFAGMLAGCAATGPAPAARTYDETRPITAPVFVDFAQLEYLEPLSLEERAKLMPEDLKKLDQESIDRIYARLTAGSIPDGAYEGQIFFTSGTRGNYEPYDAAVGRGNYGVDDLVWGYLRKMLAAKVLSLESAAEGLWKGKVFVRDQAVVRNRIASLDFLRQIGLVAGNPALTPDGKAWELFPAKLYCGQSLLDSRRESVVMDYLFTDELSGYQELPDVLPGRRGLQIRDEMRMVRPGFYLGRAYVNRIFLLTFTLLDAGLDARERARFTKGAALQEDCWPGTQMPRPAAPR